MSAEQSDRTPFVLTSKDPSFSALLEHLCQNSPLQLVTTAGPSITLETVRNNNPSFVLVDLDSVDAVEATRLILKLTLVSHAFVFFTGADAVPGHSSMDGYYSAGAHGGLQKPDGKTSLGLAGEHGEPYLKTLEALFSHCRTRRSS